MRSSSQFLRTVRLLWRLKLATLGGVLLVAIAVAAALAPLLSPYDPLATDITARLKPPIWLEGGRSEYLLGTDQVGRDILSRIIYGGQVSLLVGTLAVLLSLLYWPPAWPGSRL